MMPIKTIVDNKDGRKWEIYKKSDNEFFFKYYEYFKSIGWKLTAREGDSVKGYMTKDLIEWQFDVAV